MDVALATGYLRAWRDVVRVDPKEDVAAWLYRVTYNACIDQLRREEAAADASSASGAGAHERSGIAAGLATLPAAERVAVVLVDREGFSPSSAARILGMAESALSATLEAARERLTPHIPEVAPASTDGLAAGDVSAASAAADAIDPTAGPAGDGDDDVVEPDDQAVDPDAVGGSGGAPATTATPESATRTPSTGMPATGTPVASRPAAPDSAADVPLAPGSAADESAEPDGAADEDVASASAADVTVAPDSGAAGSDAPGRGGGDPDDEVVASSEDAPPGRPAAGQATPPQTDGPPAEGAPATGGRQIPGNGSGLQESSPPTPVSGTVRPNGNGRAATPVGRAPAVPDGDDHADEAASGDGDGDGDGAVASRSANGTGSTSAGSGNGKNGAKDQPEGDRGNGANRNRGKGRRARRRAQHAAGQGLAERPGSQRDDTT